MNGPTVLLLLAPVALAYAVLCLATSRSLQRRRERPWRRWEMSVEESGRLREGLREL